MVLTLWRSDASRVVDVLVVLKYVQKLGVLATAMFRTASIKQWCV